MSEYRQFYKDTVVTIDNIVSLLDAGESIAASRYERPLTEYEADNLDLSSVRANLPPFTYIGISKRDGNLYHVTHKDTSCHRGNMYHAKTRFNDPKDMLAFLTAINAFDIGFRVYDNDAFNVWRDEYVASGEYKDVSRKRVQRMKDLSAELTQSSNLTWDIVEQSITGATQTPDVITYYKYVPTINSKFATGSAGVLVAIKNNIVYYINKTNRDVTYYDYIGSYDNYTNLVMGFMKQIAPDIAQWRIPINFDGYDMERLSDYIAKSEEYEYILSEFGV